MREEQEEEVRKRDEEAKKRAEEEKRVEEEKRAEEAKRRAEQEGTKKRAEKEKRVEEAKKKAEEEETKRRAEDEINRITEEALNNQQSDKEEISTRDFSFEPEEESERGLSSFIGQVIHSVAEDVHEVVEKVSEDFHEVVEKVSKDVHEVIGNVSEDVTGKEEKEEARRKTQEKEEQTKNKRSNVSIHFELQYNTYWGQNLVLVGSSPTLGNWNVARGQRMRWLPGNYWELDVELNSMFEYKMFEYKYVVVLIDVDTLIDVQRWEERNNRYFDLTRFDSNELTIRKTQLWNF